MEELGGRRPRQVMRLELLDERQLGELRAAVFTRLAAHGAVNWVEHSLGSARSGWTPC